MEAACFEKTGNLSALCTRDGEIMLKPKQSGFCADTLLKYGRFSVLWINFMIILHSWIAL